MLPEDVKLALYRRMFLARYAEEEIQREYHNDEMKTPMHMSMGSEHIAAGLCEALGDRGRVFGTYRSHALYLARTGDVGGFFAEMYGKETGCCKGKAGSMHLCNPGMGFMGASAIVGGIIPVAVGYAFSNLYRGIDDITAVCFGDGATNEGTFWESMNLACVKKLPIIFVCEDNGLAVHTFKEVRNSYKFLDLGNLHLFPFDCITDGASTTKVGQIYNIVCRAVQRMKDEGGPVFLRFRYYRYLEHVGIKHDFDKGYRSEDIYNTWRDRDPVLTYRRTLMKELPVSFIGSIEQEVEEQVTTAVQNAKEAPSSPVESIYNGVYK